MAWFLLPAGRPAGLTAAATLTVPFASVPLGLIWSHGGSQGKSLFGSACSRHKLVALEGFLEMLPTCLLPSSSRLSTLLTSGRAHSAVR